MKRKTKRPCQVLAEAMETKGWDALTLAAKSGVDVTLIRRYRADEVDIGVKNAPRLAKTLGVDVTSLLYGQKAA